MSARSPSFERSSAYHTEAARAIAGAVNSNVRLGGTPFPLCFDRGEGAYLFDIDGNRFVDYVLGMGPAILGHAPRPVIDAVAASLTRGQMLGGQHVEEAELARLLQQAIPNAELVRISMSGSEVVQAALRVARAATGRTKYVKFEGQYHGWFDSVLVSYAPPVLPEGERGEIPRRPHPETRGQVASVLDEIIVLPWNDPEALESVLQDQSDQIAAVITEPMMCNTGAILPRADFLSRLREATTRHGIVLIFDEVITGFRLALGGGQQRFGITPDLSTFAKAMAGGFPIAALTGRRDLMELFGTGAVNFSGTYNSNVPSVAAAIATLKTLGANGGAVLRRIEETGMALVEGLRRAGTDSGINLKVSGVGPVFNTYFADHEDVLDYQTYKRTDIARQQRFLSGLVQRGIRPIPRGTWFVSAAHSTDDIEETLAAARSVLKDMSND